MEPLVLDATTARDHRAESEVSLSIAGVRFLPAHTRNSSSQPPPPPPPPLQVLHPNQLVGTEEYPPPFIRQPQQVVVDEDAAVVSTLGTELSLDERAIPLRRLDKVLHDEEHAPDLVGPPFVMGDHVYQWCSFKGIPYAFQHHAIVLESFQETTESPWRVRVVDFSNWHPETSNNGPFASFTRKMNNSAAEPDNTNTNTPQNERTSSGSKGEGCLRTYETLAREWKPVQYGVSFWKKQLSWSGTCTTVASDPPGMVRSRVQFLLDNPGAIPSYHLIQSNCECVAVWCRTGRWATLQASSWLLGAAAGQAKSAVTAASAAAAATVTVQAPAAGLWGYLGWTTTTTIPLWTAQPLLLPAIATYGVVTVGIPALWLHLAQKHWNKMTADLNQQFWEHAASQPDLFVECITHWSTTLPPPSNNLAEHRQQLRKQKQESGTE